MSRVFGPVSVQKWELEEWRDEFDGCLPGLVEPFCAVLAPDYLHKQDISGGGPHAIELGDDSADRNVIDERHELILVDYLRYCVRWSGFPGLDVVEMPPEEVHVNLKREFARDEVGRVLEALTRITIPIFVELGLKSTRCFGA